MLTVKSYEHMKQGVPFATLSKNFQDAITATRALGVRYLWVDCLCIIQDSANEEDWNRESVLMMNVFANAACTISATASHKGCFQNRVSAQSSCKLVTSATSELSIKMPNDRTIGELFFSRVESAPLITSGWVFQERLLSRRIIHFCSDMILFECNTLQASEEDSLGSRYKKERYVLVRGRIPSEGSCLSIQAASIAHSQPVRVKVDVQLGLDVQSLETQHIQDVQYVREQIAAGDYEDPSATRGIRGALDILLSIDASAELILDEMLAFNQRWYELV